MTVANQALNTGPLPGNGVKVDFDFAFDVRANVDINVLYTDTVGGIHTLALSTDYTTTWVSGTPGGKITVVQSNLPVDATGPAPPTGSSITVYRTVASSQTLNLTNTGAYDPSDVESALDESVRQAQDKGELANRAVQLRLDSSAAIDPSFVPIPDGYVKVNAAGTGLESVADALSSAQSIWIPATAFYLTPAFGAVTRPACTLAAGTTKAFHTLFRLPAAGWSAFTVTMWYEKSSGASGDVRWGLGAANWATLLSSLTVNEGTDTLFSVGPSNYLYREVIVPSPTITGPLGTESLAQISISRSGGHPDDTLSADIYVLGVHVVLT